MTQNEHMWTFRKGIASKLDGKIGILFLQFIKNITKKHDAENEENLYLVFVYFWSSVSSDLIQFSIFHLVYALR